MGFIIQRPSRPPIEWPSVFVILSLFQPHVKHSRFTSTDRRTDPARGNHMAHDTDVAADSPRTTPPASLNTDTTKVEKSSAISSPTGGFSDGDKNPSDLNLAAVSAQNGPDVTIPPAAHEPPELSKKSKTIIVSALCVSFSLGRNCEIHLLTKVVK